MRRDARSCAAPHCGSQPAGKIAGLVRRRALSVQAILPTAADCNISLELFQF
jgi:hypothetical protein